MPGFEFTENVSQQAEGSAVSNLFDCIKADLEIGNFAAYDSDPSSSSTVERDFPVLMLFDSSESDVEVELDEVSEFTHVADSSGKKYLPETVSNSEFEAVKNKHHIDYNGSIKETFTREQLLEIKEDINNQGVTPENLLVNGLDRSRLLCVGELHSDSDNLRDTVAESMKSLSEHGATHLAIEVDERMQGNVDRFLKGEISFDQIGLEGDVNNTHFRDMLLAANKEGLEVKCVDHKEKGLMSVRNNFMSANLRDILAAEAGNKVVFLVGASHLTTGASSTALSVPEQIRRSKDSAGMPVYSDDVYNINANPNMELTLLTQGLTDSVGVDIYTTRQAFRDFPSNLITSSASRGSTYARNSDFDGVLLMK